MILSAAGGIIGQGMDMGLCGAVLATRAGVCGQNAPAPITGITPTAGFAPSVGWPLSGLMLAAGAGVLATAAPFLLRRT